jgi:homoserine dehydrogenase
MPAIEELLVPESPKKPVLSPVRVGIVGYGTVGQATAEILASHGEEIRQRTGGVSLQVTRISRKTPRAQETGVHSAPVVEDWREVTGAADVDIVIEAIGGTGVAREVVRAAIANGKPVVTANKALVARHGQELFALAYAKNLPIGIEASVAGGVPVIRAISEALAADRIHAVYGIVNGTCNYVLTQMDHYEIDFAQALHQAQAAGYAEADSSLDIDGLDARDKITILARIAFHGELTPDQVPTTGIRNVTAIDFHYARRLDATIRLVASAERLKDGINVSVRPRLVPRDSMLAKVNGANNAIFITGEKAGTQMFSGQGAGGGATGTAVLSDVIHIARHFSRQQNVPDVLAGLHNGRPIPLSDHSRPLTWYLRLTVADHPGVLAQVAEAIAREHINIDSVIQEPHMKKERLSFVITLEPVRESIVRDAVQAINKFGFMLEPALLLPVVSEAG